MQTTKKHKGETVMGLDLEPPRPSKEFHDAYAEIYGKKKNKKSASLDLPTLDEPPIKLDITPEKKEKSFFTKLFKKKDLGEMDSPPKKELDALDMSPKRSSQPEEELMFNLNDDFLSKPIEFTAHVPKPMPSLEELDIPSPPKKKKILPNLFKKENKLDLMDEPPMKELDKLDTPPKKKKGKVHDFLAEVKFGGKKNEEIMPPKKPLFKDLFKKKEEEQVLFPTKEELPEAIPELKLKKKKEEVIVFDEHKESLFEKEKVDRGARDIQFTYEKKHPHEMGGFEFLEDIRPPQKPKQLRKSEELILPKVKEKDFKDTADFKNHIKRLKELDKKAKKQIEQLNKAKKQAKPWKSKLDKQEYRIKEKMEKMTLMEKELHEKQEEVKSFESRLAELHKQQDQLLEKERELKQRQEDIHETEIMLKNEENSVIEKIKTLEADQKLLEKEQNSIVKTVNKIEEERKRVEEKAKEFNDMLKKIDSAERSLKRRSDLLDDREALIKRKEKQIEKDVGRVKKLKKTAEKLKDAEKTYESVKERLRKLYKEQEYNYLQKAARPEPRVVPIEPTYQIKHNAPIKHVDITNLLSATRQLIMEKHYDEANRNINVLLNKYMNIPDSNPRKKEIYYEILGLKNMLKLGLLE
ncbi:hypothetical protein COV16_02150 [Candidatus Woesearchaeota archaeon CG10_big_fil_rev_8_21_14_0_10_34_8]|nr:MAG: hypothetical protein COV16_02150 [Candidatus Woesearchaeota archaeon CG10_big_fil_rev_8_21_14_0_10_34_8]